MLCNKCKNDKGEIDFSLSNLNREDRWCKVCVHEYNQKYYQANKEDIIASVSEYQINNRDTILIKSRARSRLQINRDKQQNRKKHKRINDPIFKMREIVSNSIRSFLNKNGIRKNNNSVIKFLPYSIEELKQYLESQFELWMTWENQGVYKSKTWDDSNPSTWVWNLDHIIPHSIFHYKTMDCQEFRDCWALSNLRPLSAKQNIIDGNRR